MKRKRILSFVLALAMLLSLMSTATYAEGENRTLERIEVTTDYYYGYVQYYAYERMIPDSIQVKAIYSDDSEEILEEGQYEVTYQEGRDSFRAGDTKVSISFGGKTTTLTIDRVNAVTYYAGELKWSIADFSFDGNQHTIYLTNLPSGMSARYEDNQYTYAGEYIAKATLIYNANDYQVMYTNGSKIQRQWEIQAVEQPIDLDNTATLAKGGSTINLNALVEGAKGPVSFSFSKDTDRGCSIDDKGILTSGDEECTVFINVDIAAVDVNGDQVYEYNAYDGFLTVTITDKPTAELIVVQPDGVFGRELASPTFDKPEETIEPVITYQDAAGKSIEKPIYPGSYTVTVTYETDTYIYEGSDTFTIAKAEIAPVVTIEDWSYGGGARTPVITGNAGDGAVTYTYAVRDSEEYIDAVPTNAGAYTVKATIAETANYLGASATADFTIRKATIAPTVCMEDWTYGEAAKTPVISGNTSNGDVVYTYAAQGSSSYTNVVPSNAGAYTVRAEIAGTDNYEGTVVTDDFTIKKANIAPTIQIANWTYGAEASVPSVDGNPGNAAVTYLYTNDTYSSAEVPKEAGSYTVTATVAESANYLGDTVSTNFTIGKAEQIILGDLSGLVIGDEVDLDTIFDAPGELSYALDAGDTGSTLSDTTLMAGAAAGTIELTVTAQSTTNYHEASRTISILVSAKQSQIITVADTEEDTLHFTYGDTVVIAASSNAAGAELSYSAPANEVLTVEDDGEITILNAGTAVITITASETASHAAAHKTVTVHVVPKQIAKPMADTRTFTYTGSEQTYRIPESDAYSVTGNERTDAGVQTVIIALQDPINTCWDDGTTDVIRYPFEILRKEIPIPVNTETYLYHGAEQTYGISSTADYTVSGDVTMTDAGTYSVTLALTDLNNTQWSDGTTANKTASFTIQKATITITAMDQTISRGDMAPDLTAPVSGTHYTVSGLANGDVLGGAIIMEYQTDGTAVTPDTGSAGSYDIVISGAEVPEGNNYEEIRFLEGTLTITAGTSSDNSDSFLPTVPDDVPSFVMPAAPTVPSVPAAPADSVEPDRVRNCAKDSACLMSSFSDLAPSAWYHDGVHYVLDAGLMRGVGDGLFAPDGAATRAMIVTVLWRLAGSPDMAGAPAFFDVAADDWYADAVAWAAENRITLGYDDGSFGAVDPITREQLLSFLHRFAFSMEQGSDAAPPMTEAYTYSAWAEPHVIWACERGLMENFGIHMGDLMQNAARAEIAMLLYRFSDYAAMIA